MTLGNGILGARRRVAAIAAAFALAASPVAAGQTPLAAQEAGEGRWETTTPLSVPRYDHTATLLVGGKVLVTAGRRVVSEEPTTVLATAEVYDPHSEEWQATGSLTEARWSHTATLLHDGRVLVTGGFAGPYRATNAQPVLDSAELYNPRSGTWTTTPPMATRRALHSATLLPDGRVLVAGGRTCNAPPPAACNFLFRTDTAEVFDPATGTWTTTGPLVQDRHTTAAVVLADGKVLIPAGFSSEGTSSTADLYDPTTGTSVLTAGNLNRARARQGAMLLPDGRVLVAAGFLGEDTAETYDPATGTWSLTGDMMLTGPAPQPARRFNFNYAVLPNGKALVAGGAVFPPAGRTRTAEVFDPASGQWSWAAEMNDEHGSSGSLSNSVPAVVLSSNPWTFEARPEACAPHCGKVLVAGNSPTGSVEMYIPACPAHMPAAPQQLSCVGASRAAERPGQPAGPAPAPARDGTTDGRPDGL